MRDACEALGCEQGAPERGGEDAACAPCDLLHGSNVTPDEVSDLVDAVTGATWNTLNRIMAQRFHDSLAQGIAKVPAYRPPGETLAVRETPERR